MSKIQKWASGWNSSKLPGQIFSTKEALKRVLKRTAGYGDLTIEEYNSPGPRIFQIVVDWDYAGRDEYGDKQYYDEYRVLHKDYAGEIGEKLFSSMEDVVEWASEMGIKDIPKTTSELDDHEQEMSEGIASGLRDEEENRANEEGFVEDNTYERDTAERQRSRRQAAFSEVSSDLPPMYDMYIGAAMSYLNSAKGREKSGDLEGTKYWLHEAVSTLVKVIDDIGRDQSKEGSPGGLDPQEQGF